MSPKCVVNLHERVLLGCLKAATLDTAHVLIMARLGSRWSGSIDSLRRSITSCDCYNSGGDNGDKAEKEV